MTFSNINMDIIFTNNRRLDYVDYNYIFKNSLKTASYQLEELVKFLSGNNSKANLYNNIQLNEHEILCLFNNVENSNVTNISDVDKLVYKSICIGNTFRIFKLVDGADLKQVAPFSFIYYTIQDQNDSKPRNCISLFLTSDKLSNEEIFMLILNYLENFYYREFLMLGIDLNLICRDEWNFNVNHFLFIIRYFKSLLTPLVKLFMLTKDDKNIIIHFILSKKLFNINEEFISKIFDYISSYDTNYDLEYDQELICILNNIELNSIESNNE